MVEGGRGVLPPDMVHAFDGVATVGGDEAVKEGVIALDGHIEAAPGEGAGHGFDVGVRPVDGLAHTALDAVGDHVKGGDDFIGDETAKISDDFFARIVQLPGAFASLRVEFFYLRNGGHSKLL
jgi:hypothetical protein